LKKKLLATALMRTSEVDRISSVIQGLTVMREDASPVPRVFRYYDTRYRGIRATVVAAPAKTRGFSKFFITTHAGLSPSSWKTLVYSVQNCLSQMSAQFQH
jgi:hypothetical protein